MTPTRKKEVEQFAMQILSNYSIHDNPGKHLKEIINGENISLIDYHEWSEEICGRFLYIDEEPVIFYNAKHTEPMQAFTIAHELGHYFLGHLDGTEAEIICIDRDFNRLDSNDDALEKEVEANYFASCLLMPLNLLSPVFWSFMERINRRGVLYVDTQQCNFLDYKQCIRTLQLYFLASESAIRYRPVNIGWMKFNIHFEPTVDRGISIAEYPQQLYNRKNDSLYS